MKAIQYLREKTGLRALVTALAVAAAVFLATYQMHYSAAEGYREFLDLPAERILLNCGIMLWVLLCVKLLLQRWHLAVLATGLLTTVWSIVDFFVMKFHGSPLFFSEFRNFTTAMDVAEDYRFIWERRITWLLLLGLALLLIGVFLWVLRGRKKRFFSLKELLATLAVWGTVTVLLYLTLFTWVNVKPRKTMGWTWTKGVRQYGYLCAIVEDVDRSMNALVEPEGYSPEKLAGLEKASGQPEPAVKPDIFIILNESFYDLHDVLNFTSDVDPLEAFYGQENAIYGKAIVPSALQGTNNTEYELLTSKSMHLLSMAAPFNYVNLSRDTDNIVRYLQRWGYSSLALHCSNPSNYSRNRAYPEMGFQQVVMGEKNFTYNFNGSRRWLDADNYRDMLRLYEQMGEGPRLVYLLTYQNHGGYEVNPDSLDTVHVKEDYGGYTDDLNEYLSSVRLSAEALDWLLDTLRESDRPVMVIMLGDHGPTIINHVEESHCRIDETWEIRMRMTPYLIWTNYPIAAPEDPEYVSVPDLLPLALRAAGFPLTFYQDYLLSLHKDVPIRTLNGYYLDRNGVCGIVDETCPWYERIMLAYYLEYNALKGGSDYREDLFTPQN